jgi:trehalose-6-phosphate synthase
MSQSILAQLEERFNQLPISEQKALLDRLARRVHAQTIGGDEDLIAQMAADPDVQREIREIEREFAFTVADGLNHT